MSALFDPTDATGVERAPVAPPVAQPSSPAMRGAGQGGQQVAASPGRRGPWPAATCLNCGGTAKRRDHRFGLCSACYQRWNKAGRPDKVPDPKPPAGNAHSLAKARAAGLAKRREQKEKTLQKLREYLETGLTVKAAARRLGLAYGTTTSYRRLLIQRGLITDPTNRRKTA